jgi:hypothetical protein
MWGMLYLEAHLSTRVAVRTLDELNHVTPLYINQVLQHSYSTSSRGCAHSPHRIFKRAFGKTSACAYVLLAGRDSSGDA